MAPESGKPTAPESDQPQNITYELFIGALSVLSIVNIVLSIIIRDPVVAQTTVIIDGVLSLIFMADFLQRLFKAESKGDYFFRQAGWADLLASLPFQQLKIFRTFRIVRVVRLMKKYGAKAMLVQFVENRASSALLALMLMIILVLEFGSMAMVWAETRSPDANITTAGDAVWYTYVTITTVGYGDRYPVTSTGRLLGVLIMTAGVGLFGTLTGFLANAFLSPPKKKEPPPGAPEDPKTKLEELKQLWAQQQAAMQAKIDELEKQL